MPPRSRREDEPDEDDELLDRLLDRLRDREEGADKKSKPKRPTGQVALFPSHQSFNDWLFSSGATVEDGDDDDGGDGGNGDGGKRRSAGDRYFGK